MADTFEPLDIFDEISGSADGEAALIKFRNGDTVRAFAIPEDQLLPLMLGLSQTSSNCAKILKRDPGMKHLLPAERWEIDTAPDGGLMFTFALAGGMEITIGAPRAWLPGMRETLESIEGKQPEVPDGAKQ